MSRRPENRSREEALRGLLAGLLRKPGQAAWEWLVESESRQAAAATYFLLDPEPPAGPEGGVERFVCRTLRRMLPRLTGQSVQHNVPYLGEVRGRISWAATLRARSAKDFNPAAYVCRRVRQLYDTEENQLLKFLLVQLQWCMELVPDELRNGFCCLPESNSFQIESTPDRLRRIEAATLGFLRDVRIRQVTLVPEIEARHQVKAETSRIEDYGDAVRLYRSFKQGVLSPNWERLAGSGRRALPLPGAMGKDRDGWMEVGAEVLRSMI